MVRCRALSWPAAAQFCFASTGGLRPRSSLRDTDGLVWAKCVFFHREGAEERRESALRTLRLRGEKKKGEKMKMILMDRDE